MGVDVKDTYLIHIGLPTRDIVTDIMAMEFDSDEYDVVIGMDVICNGDLAITNYDLLQFMVQRYDYFLKLIAFFLGKVTSGMNMA